MAILNHLHVSSSFLNIFNARNGFFHQLHCIKRQFHLHLHQLLPISWRTNLYCAMLNPKARLSLCPSKPRQGQPQFLWGTLDCYHFPNWWGRGLRKNIFSCPNNLSKGSVLPWLHCPLALQRCYHIDSFPVIPSPHQFHDRLQILWWFTLPSLLMVKIVNEMRATCPDSEDWVSGKPQKSIIECPTIRPETKKKCPWGTELETYGWPSPLLVMESKSAAHLICMQFFKLTLPALQSLLQLLSYFYTLWA